MSSPRGYVLRISSEEDDQYSVEEYAIAHPLEVLAEVLDWLGYGDYVPGALGLLSENTGKGLA